MKEGPDEDDELFRPKKRPDRTVFWTIVCVIYTFIMLAGIIWYGRDLSQ